MAPTQQKAAPLGATSNQTGKEIYKSIKGSLSATIPAGEFFPIDFAFEFSNWDKLLPYRFLILEAKKSSQPEFGSTEVGEHTEYNIISMSGYTNGKLPIYVFPIAPQSISIDLPFASQTTVLSDGILIESNGAPLRMITISGTTGIVPFREIGTPSVGAGFGFADNVANAAQSIAKSAKAAGNAVGAISGAVGGGGSSPDPFLDNTGYAQFHKLKGFLELWALISKRPENKNLRLAFDIAKDNTTYLINPKRFTATKSADSPMEYKYSIQMEAWKNIRINGGRKDFTQALQQGVFENLSKVQAIVQVAQAIRKVLQSVMAMGNAIRADFAKLVNMVREVILIAKDIAGIAKSIIDLPGDLIRAIKGPIMAAIEEVKGAWAEVAASIHNFPIDMRKLGLEATNAGISADGLATVADAGSVRSAGLTSTGTAGATAGTDGTNAARPGAGAGSTAPKVNASPLIDTILNDPVIGGPLLAVTNLDQLTLPINLQIKIQEEVNRVRNYTRQNFTEMKEFAQSFSRDSAVAFGLGDATTDATLGYYSAVYPSGNRKPTRKEFDLLNALRSFVRVLDDLTVFEVKGDNAINESFNFIGKLAPGANIAFNISKSKRAVPVIYEKTIEEMAQFYLGDSNRATEIVILNGLAAPFIDETGTDATLLSNATGNSLNISDGSALYIGQKIILSSTVVVPFSRAILDIRKLSPSHYLISVDGAADLSRLKLTNSAKITYFQRGTVNSNNTIFIPSNLDISQVPDRMRPLPYYFQDVDGLAKFTGVDIALGSNNDIVMSKNGDLALAGGLANLQQALKIKFITPRGSLIRHQGFGCGITPGTSQADTSAGEVKDQAEATISADSRFSEIQFLQIAINGPVLSINGSVGVNSSNAVLPFSLAVS